jgi:lipopolysaccharide assembly protein A
MQYYLIFAIALAIISIAFALQNDMSVTVTFGVWSFDSSLAMMLVIAAGIGATISVLLSWPSFIKNQWVSTRLRRQVSKLEEDKAALKQRNTQLEEELAKLTPEPIPEPPPRYLGLKSMLLGNGSDKPNASE